MAFPFDPTRTVETGSHVHYIDPGVADDDGDGSIGSPWKLHTEAHYGTLIAGDIVYLLGGTHLLSALSSDVNTSAFASGTPGNLILVTSHPDHEPVIDCDVNFGYTWFLIEGIDYWDFTHLSFVNHESAWRARDNLNPCNNLNFHNLLGVTGADEDANNGLILMDSDNIGTDHSFDRIKVIYTGAHDSGAAGMSGIYLKRMIDDNITVNRIETYNIAFGVFFKHGIEDQPVSSGNCTVSNSFFSESTRADVGYNQAGVHFVNCVMAGGNFFPADDGGEAGDWNTFTNCTIRRTDLKEEPGGGSPGAKNTKFFNCILEELSLERDVNVTSTITLDSDFNLYDSNIIEIDADGETIHQSYTLTQWQDLSESQGVRDANSVQGAPNYLGGTIPSSVIADYELLAGPGFTDGPGGISIGADVSLIGILAGSEAPAQGGGSFGGGFGGGSFGGDSFGGGGSGDFGGGGVADITLDDAVATAVGAVHVRGAASVPLADAVASTTATANNRITADVTLDDAVANVTGAVGVFVEGVADITLDDVATESVGGVAHRGTADVTLADAVSTAVGRATIRGSINVTLEGATAATFGFVGDGVFGGVDVLLDDAVASAQGISGAFPLSRMYRVSVPQRSFRVTVPLGD